MSVKVSKRNQALASIVVLCLCLAAALPITTIFYSTLNKRIKNDHVDAKQIYRTSHVSAESFELALFNVEPHEDPITPSWRENSRADGDQWIFFVTPTYKRKDQLLDMTRLSQTLMHDKRIYWIVVEDRAMPTMRIRWILERSGLRFAHLAVESAKNRNLALQMIETRNLEGVVYFGDDDNAYDIRLFKELRKTTGVSVFGVGFSVGQYERCVVNPQTGKVERFATNWVAHR
ncbi:hypothetical protein HDU82_000565, partial [Entophlyctis luteolus]